MYISSVSSVYFTVAGKQTRDNFNAKHSIPTGTEVVMTVTERSCGQTVIDGKQMTLSCTVNSSRPAIKGVLWSMFCSNGAPDDVPLSLPPVTGITAHSRSTGGL
ncbi:hypothetical protein WA026_023157 [Henosepilachna vigintioctopunctata]|uniref:Ig-like domain-containing protein n=1 Tax=Henosepilachna vigintioctopunctata TaxID=420089 RepID=A0AAW1TYC1_9CUCU